MQMLVKQVLTPIIGRLGTLASGFLVSQGVSGELTSSLVVATGVVLSLAFDAGVVIYAKRRTTR